ncbi:MAG: DUF4390 domain-containing protein [Sterolibacterium sp.]|nr:DUF4390 domain-containing protein [Sterolibacterium sp.]
MSRTTWAGTIEPISAKLSSGEEAYVLSSEFGIDLGGHFEDAISRGVPLYFVLELDITRNRWYWPNEHIAGRSLNYRLAYIPLTRQYRLSRDGTLHQNFASLGDALRMLGRVAALPVADRNLLKVGETYQVALRLALDRQQLPKPLQVDAIANRDWQIEAKVLRWQFIPTNVPTPAVATEREPK